MDVEDRTTISECTRRRQRAASRRRPCTRRFAPSIGSEAPGGRPPGPVVEWEHRIAAVAAITLLASVVLVVAGAS
jgi:hypothetical protein